MWKEESNSDWMNSMEKLNIELNTIEELFQEPDFNPFDPGSRCESGVADLYNQTQDLSQKEPVEIVIKLARGSDDEDLLAKTGDAMERYCEVQIAKSDREIYDIRRQGKRDLGWAVLFSMILLLGAYFITQFTFLPELFIYLLSTGAGIIAWVILWPPLDSILYEWSPYRESKRRYRQLQSAKIVINSKGD
jgi:hypothetical protein